MLKQTIIVFLKRCVGVELILNKLIKIFEETGCCCWWKNKINWSLLLLSKNLNFWKN